jgi:ABC-type multidrug transport system fused ATPase/permease subunit
MVIETSAMVAVLLFLALRGTQDERDLARLAALAYIVLRTLPTLNSLVSNLNAMRYGRPALTALAARMELTAPAWPGSDDAAATRLTSPTVDFVDVSFAYDETPVLDGVTLSIPYGRAVGIVGTTGSGKSTLLDMMTGLLEPRTGSVLVSGQPMHDVRRAWFRSVAVVPQQVMLLDAPLWENVALGRDFETVDRDALAFALRAADLDSVVAELPEGVHTPLGERGVRLSGGQRQRVAIARALYRDPSVLILDEATSALDNETERTVMAAITGAGRTRTLVIVAHRLTTVEHCDEVIVLEAGRVVDRGTFSDLAERSAAFRRFAAQPRPAPVADADVP